MHSFECYIQEQCYTHFTMNVAEIGQTCLKQYRETHENIVKTEVLHLSPKPMINHQWGLLSKYLTPESPLVQAESFCKFLQVVNYVRQTNHCYYIVVICLRCCLWRYATLRVWVRSLLFCGESVFTFLTIHVFVLSTLYSKLFR